MVASRGTYIDALLSAAGGRNLALSFSQERYPKIPEDFNDKADVVFLSSEPFHYQEKHISKYQSYGHKIRLVDGEKLSWHGTYTCVGLDYLIEILFSFYVKP